MMLMDVFMAMSSPKLKLPLRRQRCSFFNDFRYHLVSMFPFYFSSICNILFYFSSYIVYPDAFEYRAFRTRLHNLENFINRKMFD